MVLEPNLFCFRTLEQNDLFLTQLFGFNAATHRAEIMRGRNVCRTARLGKLNWRTEGIGRKGLLKNRKLVKSDGEAGFAASKRAGGAGVNHIIEGGARVSPMRLAGGPVESRSVSRAKGGHANQPGNSSASSLIPYFSEGRGRWPFHIT